MSEKGTIFIARGLSEEQLDKVERVIVEQADPEMERLALEARLGQSGIIGAFFSRIERLEATVSRLEAELERREH